MAPKTKKRSVPNKEMKPTEAPQISPQLQRSTSGGSPLGRHDGISPSDQLDAGSSLEVPQASWDTDFKAVMSEFNPSKVRSATLLSTYASVASSLDDDEDAVFAEGLVRLFEAVGVDPATDLVALEFAHRCGAQEMGIFRRREFIRGMASLGVDTLEGLRKKVAELRSATQDPCKCQRLYLFSFNLALESPARALSIEDACSLWRLFMPSWPHLEAWTKWLNEKQSRPVSKDVWDMFWKLAMEEPEDMSTYDENLDWPSVFDNFIAHLRSLRVVA
mmetsp:Transcript_33168/g.77590  ORF Transcript_33168/g.77590 Transcript_33168/m.77590 type:complete len:275 (+) Transcript_33168:75-899(+)